MVEIPIIPTVPHIIPEFSLNELNQEAICVFMALGFFLGTDDWYKDRMALQPACRYEINESGTIKSEKRYWQWHYSPREIGLKQATEEFAHLFEELITKHCTGQEIILPLSGGLDSRTLASALKGHRKVKAFSYEFTGGLPETKYGQAIAKVMDFDFRAFRIPSGYLWGKLERLSKINGCYAEFTHPRQMAFFDEYPSMGDLFLLGHWGDVLFDDMGVPDDLPFEQQVEVVLRKIVKKGGRELADALWEAWGLIGRFDEYLRARVERLLADIEIENANARIRAFKSMYWAPRWTSVNLSVFEALRPVYLPYYDNRMCQFICTIPERHLAGRQIQIEYIKMKSPELARIAWQAHHPFNLYTFQWNKSPWNWSYKVYNKGKNVFKDSIGEKFIQRNWELQFLGKKNKYVLESFLSEKDFKDLVPSKIIDRFWEGFWNEDQIRYSHSLSMLLTFSMFQRLAKFKD